MQHLYANETPPDVQPTCPQGHYLNALGDCQQCDQEARDEAMEQRSLDEWKEAEQCSR